MKSFVEIKGSRSRERPLNPPSGVHKAKYAGICIECDKEIRVGDLIHAIWHVGPEHVDCENPHAPSGLSPGAP